MLRKRLSILLIFSVFFLACILILLVNSVAHPKLRLHVIPLSLQDIPVRLGSLEVPVKTKYVTEFAL